MILSSMVLIAGCGSKKTVTVYFGDRQREVDDQYTNRHVNTEDIGNTTEKVLALTKQTENNSDTIQDTILFLSIKQPFSSAQYMKEVFAKNYSSLLWYEVLRDEEVTIACNSQKTQLLSFRMVEDPLSEAYIYISQLFVTDPKGVWSYIVSYVSTEKKSSKELIKEMKQITCNAKNAVR